MNRDRKPTLRLSAAVEWLEARWLLSFMPLAPEFRVNSTTWDDQRSPAAAADADGDVLVVWGSDQHPYDGEEIYAQRYDRHGARRGGAFRVNVRWDGAQSEPAVGMNPSGASAVAWESSPQDGSETGIYARSYDASGAPLSAEFRVNTYTTSYQAAAAVAVDPTGNFVVAWSSHGQDGSGGGVYARRFNRYGGALGDEFLVNAYTTGNQTRPSIAIDASGRFVVAWYDDREGGAGRDVYARAFHAGGAPAGDEFRVNTYTTGEQTFPVVAMDPDGDFVVVWRSRGQDGLSYGVYAQLFDAAAAPRGAEFRVNAHTTGGWSLPAVAMDAAGGFVVAWEDRDDLLARRYGADGAPLGEAFRANSYTTGFQEYPTVAVDGEGDFIVAWQSSDGDGGGIFAQHYVVTTAGTSAAFEFGAAPHRLVFRFDADVSAGLWLDDLIVQDVTTGQFIGRNWFVVNYDHATNTATFTYSGGGGSAGGVLPDGRYRAGLIASEVGTPAGAPTPPTGSLPFFFLQGDANRDARVNLRDFNILAANFGQANRTFAQGDFNYDGGVNLQDFNLLAARFGVALSGASSVTGDSQFGASSRDDLSDELEEMHVR